MLRGNRKISEIAGCWTSNGLIMRWMKTMTISMILCIFLSCAGSADKTVKPADIVKVTTNPKEIYIEQGALGQYLNFDFVVENLTGATLRVNKVVVSVY